MKKLTFVFCLAASRSTWWSAACNMVPGVISLHDPSAHGLKLRIAEAFRSTEHVIVFDTGAAAYHERLKMLPIWPGIQLEFFGMLSTRIPKDPMLRAARVVLYPAFAEYLVTLPEEHIFYCEVAEDYVAFSRQLAQLTGSALPFAKWRELSEAWIYTNPIHRPPFWADVSLRIKNPPPDLQENSPKSST